MQALPPPEGPSSIAPVAWPDAADPPVVPLEPLAARWTLWVGAASLLAILGSVVTASIAPSRATEHAAAPGSASVLVEDAPAADDVTARALEGDGRALEQLEKLPAETRSVTEIIALAEGQRARDLGELREIFNRSGGGLAEAPRRVVASHARRADTGIETLGLLATSGGADGVDLIFSVWRSAPKGSALSVTAAQLLLSPQVRAQSSDALRVAIDLQRVADCKDASLLVDEAARVADRRALRALARLTRRDGCGPERRDDCFACLRGSSALGHALRSAKNRPEPRP